LWGCNNVENEVTTAGTEQIQAATGTGSQQGQEERQREEVQEGQEKGRQMISGFESWSELDLLAGTICGEARGEPWPGKVGIGIVIANRVQRPCWWGRNWREVILADNQFSCWKDANLDVIKSHRDNFDMVWIECLTIAEKVYLGHMVDRIGGPTHYHEEHIKPAWAGELTYLTKIGKHMFYRGN
jgi:N-acetylmuramoyl-L-alanine amidase